MAKKPDLVITDASLVNLVRAIGDSEVFEPNYQVVAPWQSPPTGRSFPQNKMFQVAPGDGIDPTPLGKLKGVVERGRAGNFDRPSTPVACFVPERGGDPIKINPREDQKYIERLYEILGLKKGGVRDPRYAHLGDADLDLLRHFVARCSSAFWLDETPHTQVKCFEHDIELTGKVPRQAPYRLKGQDAEGLDKCIQEDVKRGQLIEGDGSEEITSPGFVVWHPKLRMVVDYRKLNAKTSRFVFLIPRGDDQKTKVAQAWYITMLDAVWGFNHIRNTKRARKALAMITMSGIYLPICLPFGPLNGPEVFQRMMH